MLWVVTVEKKILGSVYIDADTKDEAMKKAEEKNSAPDWMEELNETPWTALDADPMPHVPDKAPEDIVKEYIETEALNETEPNLENRTN